MRVSKQLRRDGERLGRAGLSARVFTLVDEFNENRTYINAIALAGRLRAIALACEYDSYWKEKCDTGFNHETYDLENASITGTLPDGKKSWWIS